LDGGVGSESGADTGSAKGSGERRRRNATRAHINETGGEGEHEETAECREDEGRQL
jgi:hypothetical protein